MWLTKKERKKERERNKDEIRKLSIAVWLFNTLRNVQCAVFLYNEGGMGYAHPHTTRRTGLIISMGVRGGEEFHPGIGYAW